MSLTSSIPYDVVVVGGSFAGLSAALMLARARKQVLIIDAGSPRNRFAAHSHGLLGHDGKPPRQLLRESMDQVLAYPCVQHRSGLVVRAAPCEAGFQLELDSGEQVLGRRLVLAGGMRDVLPDLDGVASRWGTSVLHCPYCHGYEFAGKPLGVLGNGPMSPHQAQIVSQWGPTVYFSQARYEPDALQAAQLQALGVSIERVPVVALRGPGQSLEQVILEDGRQLAVQAMFTAPRVELSNDLPVQLGCVLAEGPTGPYVKVDEARETSVPGVYAAGDLAGPMPSLPLAVSSGAMAGLAAHRSLIEEAMRLSAA